MLETQTEYGAFCQLWNSIFYPETLIPESLLESIKARYRLLLLSNTNAIHFEMLREKYPILRHFDHYILSYQVGALKPEPEIYREAIRHAGCEPGECFYTDDIAPYVEGARREGIDAVQFTGVEPLRSEMRARGIC
jgi:putative hydrolase of the HAD superfamily